MSYQIRIYNPSNHPYLLLFFTLRTLSLCGSLKKGLFNPDFVSVLTEILHHSQQIEKPNPPPPFPSREGGAGNLTPPLLLGEGSN